jgi:hypothetical protein
MAGMHLGSRQVAGEWKPDAAGECKPDAAGELKPDA